ncbi:MAG: GNAT family N-acetyltransferase [Candidatus Liptonbacteria bacterium]|nr:GNAT family N-acetyltransferase [Candidatus Liptonbacteria bacterium]
MEIESKKVNLRAMRLDDAGHFVSWLKDPDISRFINAHGESVEAQRELIAQALNHHDTSKIFSVETKDGALIGKTGFFIDKKNSNAEFFIFIGEKKFWRGGYGYDVCKTMWDYGFKALGLHRIYSDIAEDNVPIKNLWKKLGNPGKIEGKKREHFFYDGAFHDAIHIAILRDEWLKSAPERKKHTSE